MAVGISLLEFSNVGSRSNFRSFPGFPTESVAQHHRLSPRDALRVVLDPGDVVSLRAADAQIAIAAFGKDGECALSALNLVDACLVSQFAFDRDALNGWARSKSLSPATILAAPIHISGDLVLRVGSPCTAWIIAPSPAADTVAGQTLEDVQISISRAAGGVRLPEPIGEIREEFTIGRGTACAYELREGEFVQIIDIEGQQCSDFMAFDARELDRGTENTIDSTATRSMVRRTYPKPGLLDKFFDRDMRPMLQVVQDTCGRHDALGLACTARGYEDRGFPGHVNCSDNISDAVAPYGIAPRPAWPAI
ncbi:MAG: urea carboxylase-associated family protein, partial [Pseudomonadota bacterium]